MSAKKDLYLAVRQQILNKTSVVHCQLFNSQFDSMEEEDTFEFPCAFIEFTALDWLTKSEGYQEADTTIRIHLGFESLKTEELDILDLNDAVHKSLQRLEVKDLFTPLDRSFEGQDTNHDNVIVWQMDYETLLSDNEGNRNADLVKTTIEELCIEKDADAPRLKRLP